MRKYVNKEDTYKHSRWTGGSTTEFAIFPAEAKYLDRDFVWRLSSATLEKEEATFSKLPGYNRILVVLEGKVVLVHEGVRMEELSEGEQDSFDGKYSTASFGKITDYNLMVRKGNEGTAEVLELSKESRTLEVPSCGKYSMGAQAIYVTDGFAVVTVKGETSMVRAGQQFVVEYGNKEQPSISIMGEGRVIHCSILFHYQEGELGPVPIQEKPASLADFRECVFIANTQYRFSKYTNKKLKRLWYDEALQAGIRKLNRFYLTDLAYCLEFLLLLVLGRESLSGWMWVVGVAGLTLLHLLLIAPLMYLLVVPKPVAAHMKDIHNLTPYEKKRREYELGRNERVERILSRYKFTGRYEYDEEGNRTDDYYSNKI